MLTLLNSMIIVSISVLYQKIILIRAIKLIANYLFILLILKSDSDNKESSNFYNYNITLDYLIH